MQLQYKTTFKAKFLLISTSLLIMVILLSGLFYFSVDKLYYHFKRNRLAQDVLSSYLAVSNHTYKKLNAMGEIVAERKVEDAQERLKNATELRRAISKIRHGIATEVAFVQDEDESE